MSLHPCQLTTWKHPQLWVWAPPTSFPSSMHYGCFFSPMACPDLHPQILGDTRARHMGHICYHYSEPRARKYKCGLPQPCPEEHLAFRIVSGAANVIGPKICLEDKMWAYGLGSGRGTWGHVCKGQGLMGYMRKRYLIWPQKIFCPPARLMSSIKDNVGRGLNIALVNGKSPMLWGQRSDHRSRFMLWPAPSTPSLPMQVQVASGYSQGGLGEKNLCHPKALQKKLPSE